MAEFQSVRRHYGGLELDLGERNEQTIKRLNRLRTMLLATAIVLVLTIILLVLLLF